MCPLKSFKVKEAGEPWLTNKALEAIREKDNLLRQSALKMKGIGPLPGNLEIG